MFSDEDSYDDADLIDTSYDDIDMNIDQDEDEGKNCIILNQDNIRQRQQEDITEVSTLLSVSRASACILLLHYKWSVTGVNESWFSDEEKVRMTVGLSTTDYDISPNPNKKLKTTCGICFDDYPQSKLYDAGCNHQFCSSCWEGYITTSIHDGSGCLMLRCPEFKCGAAVDQDMVNTFVSQEDKDKYSNFLFKSYVEDNRRIKWCPTPGCDYAVKYIGDFENYDVSCNCAFGFCWNCTQEAHSPVDCDTVSNWVMKNKDESENVNWILVNSKPCPGCKKPIQKNQGCNHMTCKCGLHFCWLCLCSLKNHHSCNGFEERRMDDESENRKQMAKKLLDKYTHYYERWEANQKSLVKAKEDLQQMKSVYIQRLTFNQCQLEFQLQFIIQAWKQIIECRRVLKWTYAYGYYLPEHEHTKRHFFEYLQGEAESGLERLHHCAEKDLQLYLQAEGPSQDFNEFRTKLVHLTIVTGNYFEKLVKALQGGLADVDSLGSTSSTAGRWEGQGLDLGVQGLWSCEYCTYTNEESAIICKMCNKQHRSWSCEHCTYVNDKSGIVCCMCNQQRST
ncbi:E3 ubiquitin-protein ligase arih1 [Thalictrum thalictroides]|uniref:RBR-type E3 ubiquitin transferase n=2 Tax=Thalictrum thalictroides TaxID=46969 RepID=A0A7J6V1R5_THATH|nr:E3 ubiquitin-protein ligase arih1 [Thalictrum thalictroides]